MTVHPFAELAIVGLVVFRVWRLFALDEITDGLRRRLDREDWRGRFLDGLECPWCSSVWWAAAAVVVWHGFGGLAWSWWLIADGLVVATVSTFAALLAAALGKVADHG